MSAWTCQRVTNGVKCRVKNEGRRRKCVYCGKPKPARKKPAHMAALDLSYEQYVQINGGEHCGICGRLPSANRRLDRDHCHKTGMPRGLLCARCNRFLPSFADTKWLRKAAYYMERQAA